MRLISIDESVATAIASGLRESIDGVELGQCAELVAEVVAQTGAMLATCPRQWPFGGYLLADEDVGVVGTCAFKAGPSPDGTIEIAYFTFPPYEGPGYATEMARQLLTVALASQCVHSVIAHTLRERGASTRVLEKVGMRFHGDVEDPEDGWVWRWEFRRAA